MTKSLTLQDEEERVVSQDFPHLSFSRINRYLHCPEQYRLYYIENLRTRLAPANLVFGKVVHQSLAHCFNGLGDPVEFFQYHWSDIKHMDIDYAQRESWEKLQASGRGLIAKFFKEELHRLSDIAAAEKPFELGVSCLSLPFVGVIDLFAGLDRKLTVVDFKTSGSAYGEHEAILSDQLTVYQLAEPDAEQAALCVFVKTKEPRIEWHLSSRTSGQLIEFLRKAELLAQEISLGHFYKRPGKWCSWCDFLPVCMGDKKGMAETLVQI